MSGTVNWAILRTRGASQNTMARPTQAPALIHSAEKPLRYARPAPPKRLPEPIQVHTSVPTRNAALTPRPATMKSSWVFTSRPLRTLTKTRKVRYTTMAVRYTFIGVSTTHRNVAQDSHAGRVGHRLGSGVDWAGARLAVPDGPTG